MAYEKITGRSNNPTISLGGINSKTGKPNPTEVEGFYRGSRKAATPGINNGESTLHEFETKDGNVDVWGKTDFDSKMLNATLNAMTLVRVLGMKPVAKGRMYQFEVSVDKQNISEPAGNSSSTGSVDEDLSYDSDINDDNVLDEVSAPRAAAPKSPARVPSSKGQAETRALLSQKRG